MDITLSFFVCQRASSYLMNKSLSFAISVFVLYLAGKARMLDDTGSKLKVHIHEGLNGGTSITLKTYFLDCITLNS